MVYFTALTISLVVFIINTSFLPHFSTVFASIVLLLPFISIYSLRDKTIFPYFLAVFVGLLYDSTITGYVPVISLTLLGVTLVGKNLFARISSYGVERAGLTLTLIGYIALLGFEWKLLVSSFQNSTFYLELGISFLILLGLQILVYRLGGRYFDWVEKVTQERYR